MQITFFSVLNIPTDCLLQILNQIDSNTLVRTSATCKQWLANLELEWEARSKQISPLRHKTSSSWREHYFLNVSVLRLRQIEQINQSKFCTTIGKSIIFVENNLSLLPFKTDHKREINVIKSIEHQGVILTSSLDKTIKVWKYNSITNIKLRFTSEELDSYTSTLFPLGCNFVSGGYNGNIYYWVQHKNKYQLCRMLEQVHQATIVCFGSCSRGKSEKYLASGALDGTIGLSKLIKGKLQHLQTQPGHEDAISGLGMVESDNDFYLVTGSATDSAIKLWHLQVNTGEFVFYKTFCDAHPGGVTDIKIHFNYFFSCGKDGSVKKWSRYSMHTELNKITTAYIPTCIGDLNMRESDKYFVPRTASCTYLADGNKIVKVNQQETFLADGNKIVKVNQQEAILKKEISDHMFL